MQLCTAAMLAIPNPLLLSSHVVLIYCLVHVLWAKSGLADVFLRLNEEDGVGLVCVGCFLPPRLVC